MADAAVVPLAVFAFLLTSTAAGAYVQSLLPERHRSRETVDAVRATTGMIVTFSAVVLGLLTSAANGTFNELDGRLRGYSATLIQLNRELRDYGGETLSLRQSLRSYTAAAIADTWKEEAPPPGDYYPRHLRHGRPGEMDSAELGRMLDALELALLRLDPVDSFHQQLARESVATMETLLDLRWRLIESVQSGTSVPFLAVLVLWLVIVFACLGLTAPRNLLSYAVTGCCALVLASAVFLLLEFNQPFGGFIAVSSAPFRDALGHMEP